jgi:hypothetical protein
MHGGKSGVRLTCSLQYYIPDRATPRTHAASRIRCICSRFSSLFSFCFFWADEREHPGMHFIVHVFLTGFFGDLVTKKESYAFERSVSE